MAGRPLGKIRDVKTYADATLLGGRHRVRDMVPNVDAPDRHHDHDRLICATLADGNAGWPSCLRACSCGAQVVVSTPMIELVDSGVLWPTCWVCFLALRATLMLHDGLMPALYALGRSADAWRAVGWLNGLVSTG